MLKRLFEQNVVIALKKMPFFFLFLMEITNKLNQ